MGEAYDESSSCRTTGRIPRSARNDMITSSEFEALVEEALAGLPKQFADLLENVVIVVEEEPSDEDLDLLDDEEGDDDDELFGIYRGIALPERTHDMLPSLPDQIAIFR